MEEYLAAAIIALIAVSPESGTVPRQQAFSDSLTHLEAKLWTASGLFTSVDNYVSYGGQDGRFIGVNRVAKDFVKLYQREAGAAHRTVYNVTVPGDRSQVLRTDDYDPHTRSWYGIAAKQRRPVWFLVYSDSTSGEPTVTLAVQCFA